MISQSVSKWMRGIAILMVIASHYAGWMFVEPANPELREWVMTLGVFGVDIFLAMSGYGLVKAASKGGITLQYVWNRFKSSYLPYFIVVGVMMWLDGDFEDKDDVISFLSGEAYWFMAVLFVTYLFFMVCWKIKLLKEFTFAALLIWYTHKLYLDEKASFWIVSNMAFLVGVLFADIELLSHKIKHRFENKGIQIAIKCAILLIGFFGMRYSYHQFLALDEISYESATSIFFTITIMAISMLIPQKCNWLIPCKLLSALGTHSLFIYLLHTRLFYLIIFELEEMEYVSQVTIVGLITIVVGCLLGILYNAMISGVEKITRRAR